jgi:hypothetical protein
MSTLNIPIWTRNVLLLAVACEVSLGCIAFLARERGDKGKVSLMTIHTELGYSTYQFTTPQAPLQTNGLAPIWLLKQVSARGRLVHNLSQKVQGNFALEEEIDVRAIVGRVAGATVGGEVGADMGNEAVGCAGDLWARLFDISAR